MISDITIGSYYKGNSFIHRLDPRMKIILTALFIAIIFMCRNFLSLALMGLLLIVSIAFSSVPFRMFFKSLKPIVPIVIFTAVINMFYSAADDYIFEMGFIRISKSGLFTAVFMAVRIVCLIMSSSILTYTTIPTMLTDAIEKLLSPLKVFKIQVHTLAMMMTLALRFIPTLIEEIEKITNAQKARGADLESGKFVERIKALVPILIPLFVSAFRRAYELAFAMSCRCYTGGDRRTRMKQMKLGAGDFISLAVFILALCGVLGLNSYFGAVI